MRGTSRLGLEAIGTKMADPHSRLSDAMIARACARSVARASTLARPRTASGGHAGCARPTGAHHQLGGIHALAGSLRAVAGHRARMATTELGLPIPRTQALQRGLALKPFQSSGSARAACCG